MKILQSDILYGSVGLFILKLWLVTGQVFSGPEWVFMGTHCIANIEKKKNFKKKTLTIASALGGFPLLVDPL